MSGMEEDNGRDEDEKIQQLWIWEDPVDGTEGVRVNFPTPGGEIN